MAIPARFAPFGEGWLPVVRVMINASPTWYEFVIATGSVHTAVSDTIINAFGLEPTAGYSLVLDARTGTTSRQPQYRIESLLLPWLEDRATGTPYVYAVRLDWASELGIDGGLGTQWLRQEFGRLDIDLTTPSIELYRRA